MVLALSRVGSAQHGALRAVRQAHRIAQEDFGVPGGYKRRQAPIGTVRAFRFMIAALRRAAALLSVSFLAAGCANFSASSPGDSAPTVEARVGAPGSVWKNADGSEVWEYPSGPSGVQTFMIDIGPDRTVRAVRQVLMEEYFSKVVPGMSRDEVRRML